MGDVSSDASGKPPVHNGAAGIGDVIPAWERVRHGFSHRLRSAHTWIVQEGDVLSFVRDVGLSRPIRLVPVIGGVPLGCADIKQAGHQSRDVGELLMVDNTLPSSFGCAASRLGAHVTLEVMDRVMQRQNCGIMAVSVSKDARIPDALIWRRLEHLPQATHEQLNQLDVCMQDFDARRRQANDNAQVLAFYLACHPAVGSVYYPGMPRDPTYEVASRTLSNGFGPCVDFRLRSEDPTMATRLVGEARSVMGEWVPGSASCRLLFAQPGVADSTLLRLTCGTGDAKAIVQQMEQLFLRAAE